MTMSKNTSLSLTFKIFKVKMIIPNLLGCPKIK